MDLADIKRQATAAREFTLTVGGTRHITLRQPTQHELVLAARRAGLHNLADDAAAHVVLQRSLLLLAVVGWAGVLLADVLPTHEPAQDLLAFEPGAVALLIDAQPEWETELANALTARMSTRKTKQDTAAKN